MFWVYKFLTNCCCIAFQLVWQSLILCCIYYIIFWYKFYDAACAALSMFYEPSQGCGGKSGKAGRYIGREWEREGEYEWVPVADFLRGSGRFFQFQCGINKDFPHWAAWECCFSPTPPAPCSLLATVSPSCDDIFQLRKDHKALSKAVCRATTTRRTSRMTPSSSSGCQLEVSF